MSASDQTQKLVDSLVERARALTDEELERLAAARGAIDEAFHAGAWRAATEMLPMKADAYASAWLRIGESYVPDCLEGLVQSGDKAERNDARHWHEVARLARLAIDDELLAVLTSDSIPPPHFRQLHLSWGAMLEAVQVG